MSTLFASALDDLRTIAPQEARTAEIVTWGGRQALRLDGLALIPDLALQDATLTVEIAAEGPCYPGLVWRAAGASDYELAYAQPHTSGQWDALQYDPVMHGANTWQVFYGPAYQAATQVPTGRWFTLRVAYCGGRAAISVDGQPPLVVEQLAQPLRRGPIGLWSYLPVHYSNLRVEPCTGIVETGATPAPPDLAPLKWVRAWKLEGLGRVACEPHGALCLNRYLAPSAEPARLRRRFALAAPGEIEFALGYSDALTLLLDGTPLHHGERLFHNSPNWDERGYVAPTVRLRQWVGAGEHTLAAHLGVTEGFSWGLMLAMGGAGLRLLPV